MEFIGTPEKIQKLHNLYFLKDIVTPQFHIGNMSSPYRVNRL